MAATRRSHWNLLWWSALRYPREGLAMSGADLRDPSFEGHVKPRWQKRQRRRRRRGRARARANLSTVRWIDESICVLFYPAPEQGAQVRQIARGSQESVGDTKHVQK